MMQGEGAASVSDETLGFLTLSSFRKSFPRDAQRDIVLLHGLFLVPEDKQSNS